MVAADKESITLQELGRFPEKIRGKGNILDELRATKGDAVYSLIPIDEVTWTYPEIWTLYRFNGRSSRLETVAGTKIYNLSGYGRDPNQIKEFFEAIDTLGVPYGSLSAMLMKSWRRFLPNSVNIFFEGSINPGQLAMRPGRRDALPGRYNNVVLMDMPAAYPSAMQEPLPCILRPTKPERHESGIAEAIITVVAKRGEPWSMVGELEPWNKNELAIWFSTKIHGFWPFDELQEMEEHGYRIEILKAWKGEAHEDLFSAWFLWARSIRKLPGLSGMLAKYWTNRLWGSFAFKPGSNYTRITFDNLGEPYLQRIPFSSPNPAAHISAIVASRVRRRLYRDGLRKNALACDTDGVIVPFEQAATLRDWRRKEEMAVLEILVPEAYRYKCMRGVRNHLPIDGCLGCIGDRWHHVVSGILPNSQEAKETYQGIQQRISRSEATDIFGGMARNGQRDFRSGFLFGS